MAVSIKVEATLVSQDLANKNSTINVKLHCSWTYSSYNHKSPAGWIEIQGKRYTFNANINPKKTESGSNVIYSANHTIHHSNSKTQQVAIYAAFYTGLNAGTVNSSYAITLPAIDYEPVITSITAFNDEENPTIKFRNPPRSMEACISIDGTKDDVSYRYINVDTGSYTFNLTDEERKTLRKSITTGNSRQVRFYLRYKLNDDNRLTYLSKTLTLINHTPLVELAVEDSNAKTLALTGDKNKLIKYFSNAKITGAATPRKEATISKVSVSCGAKSIAAASGTISAVESGNFTLSTTDSRGFEVSKSVSKDIVNYIKLTCNMDAEAPTTDGRLDLSVNGNYFNSTFGAVANTLQIQYRIKENDGSFSEWRNIEEYELYDNTYSTLYTITGLDYLSVYTVQARAVDKLMVSNSSEKVVNTVPVFDWSRDDFNFNVNVNFPNKNLKDNNIGIRSTNSKGTSISCFVPNTAEDVLMLGWGNYNAGIGRTNIYGKEVNLFTTDGTGNINANGNLRVNGREYAVNKILWQGGYYMTAGHTIPLSENVSEQPNGIVLVFSYYSGGAQDYYFQSSFIPKALVAAQGGSGHTIILAGTNFNPIGTKYLYISDDVITGNDNNNATGTSNGITYNNAAFVLRYVIGV